ncbi:MAG: ABC transporter ATP-binding protein [Patescibacteria group bacterium]
MIKTENLTKTFDRGKIKAVDGLNLEVKEGEIFGFLGPNGAGKTTTIRMLMGFIRPTEGRASVFGLDCQKSRVEIMKKVGYLAGDVKLYDRYSGEYLTKFLAAFYGGLNKEWVKELTERLDIDLKRRVSDLSKGNRQKIGVLQALSGKPKLLILDEPTGGLDPLIQIEFNKIIQEMIKEGTTIFMSSHILSEVEKICDRVAILKEGKLIALKSVEELSQAKTRIVEIFFRQAYRPQDFKLPGVEIKLQEEKYLQLYLTGEVNQIIKILGQYDISDVHFNEPNLEEVFLKYYQGE